MPDLDSRIVRVGIEVNGKINWYEDLNIHATGTKFASGISNETDIKITNLSKATRDWITTAVSPYNLNRTDKKVFLEAGRKGKNVYQIFQGTIIRAEISQPPDVVLSLKAITCQYFSGTVVANNLGDAVPLSQISAKVAADLGLSLNFQAQDKLISNYSYTGGALKQVPLLGSSGGVNAFVDDGKLIVKDKNKPLASKIIVNEFSGMVGTPKLDIQGVTVTFMIDTVPTLGGSLEVQSRLYPACNGLYEIYKLDYDISNRDTPFYWTAKASRPILAA